MSEHRITLGGVELAYDQAGEGGRPLLLVHGFTGAKEDFGDWMGRFGDAGWWVVAPDLRGHGASAKPRDEADYSFATFGQDLLALVEHLGWDHYCLLGHSMGGAVAQELVIGDPDRIAGLVLMDTHHGAFEGLAPSVVRQGAELVRTEGLPALVAVLDAFATPRPAPEQRVRDTRPGFVSWNEAKLAAASPQMYAAMAVELVTRPDRLPELSALDVPTLVVVGELDTNLVAAAHRMGAAIPVAQLAMIPDAAHSPQFENPDAWWGAVSSFLLSMANGTQRSPSS
ncbi:MAG: alpha/beta fold hydrolase [Acidimicrobiales bacterium]